MTQNKQTEHEDKVGKALTELKEEVNPQLKTRNILRIATAFVVVSSVAVSCAYSNLTDSLASDTPETPSSFDRDSIRTRGPILVECDISSDFSKEMQTRQETRCNQRKADQEFLHPFSKVQLKITRD